MTTASAKIGFLGAGQMAEALIAGMIRAGIAPSSDINISDPVATRLDFMSKEYAVVPHGTNIDCVKASEIVIIAVKPQSFDDLAKSLEGMVGQDEKCFISIMAGVTYQQLHSKLGAFGDVVRVMPNTPALVGKGASAYYVGAGCDLSSSLWVEKIFNSVGICVKVDKESLLDAVTGLSGSGPAYVYMMIEAMSDGGVRMGLPRALADQLAAQTVLGGAEMVVTRGQHPAVLKNQVESPAGTTICGTNALEKGGFRSAVIEAVQAAASRSSELGKAAL